MIEIVKAPATGEMEEMEGDTTRAIDRLLAESEVKVEKVVFFKTLPFYLLPGPVRENCKVDRRDFGERVPDARGGA